MNVSAKIESTERSIRNYVAMVAFLKEHQAFLESFEGTCFESLGTIHFTAACRNLTRDQTLSIIRHFHGKWNKSYDQDKVSYKREKQEGETLGVAIYEAEAPPSCRIEEIEEEVPAHKVIRRRLVCTESEVA